MIYGTHNFENTINMIKDMANEEKEANRKGANRFKVILLTYPKVVEENFSSSIKNED